MWIHADPEPQHRNKAVLRIRDVYPGSRIRLFSILDPVSAPKNLSILYIFPKKWFLSCRK